ncbi:MAG: hypothetical protein HKP61_03065 [Dactylosporangium sp.]|nr:hypothetical protein [Dactylosporangium sp.]NNJ59936.1 hypothetical protein [Dactylosporangium sp.]
MQWGRCFSNRALASLPLTRQLAIAETCDRDDPDGQSEFWQLDLQMSFDDRSDPIDFASLRTVNTDFCFDQIGSQRAAALLTIRSDLDQQPLLRRMWHMVPTSSELTFSAV